MQRNSHTVNVRIEIKREKLENVRQKVRNFLCYFSLKASAIWVKLNKTLKDYMQYRQVTLDERTVYGDIGLFFYLGGAP